MAKGTYRNDRKRKTQRDRFEETQPTGVYRGGVEVVREPRPPRGIKPRTAGLIEEAAVEATGAVREELYGTPEERFAAEYGAPPAGVSPEKAEQFRANRIMEEYVADPAAFGRRMEIEPEFSEEVERHIGGGRIAPEVLPEYVSGGAVMPPAYAEVDIEGVGIAGAPGEALSEKIRQAKAPAPTAAAELTPEEQEQVDRARIRQKVWHEEQAKRSSEAIRKEERHEVQTTKTETVLEKEGLDTANAGEVTNSVAKSVGDLPVGVTERDMERYERVVEQGLTQEQMKRILPRHILKRILPFKEKEEQATKREISRERGRQARKHDREIREAQLAELKDRPGVRAQKEALARQKQVQAALDKELKPTTAKPNPQPRLAVLSNVSSSQTLQGQMPREKFEDALTRGGITGERADFLEAVSFTPAGFDQDIEAVARISAVDVAGLDIDAINNTLLTASGDLNSRINQTLKGVPKDQHPAARRFALSQAKALAAEIWRGGMANEVAEHQRLTDDESIAGFLQPLTVTSLINAITGNRPEILVAINEGQESVEGIKLLRQTMKEELGFEDNPWFDPWFDREALREGSALNNVVDMLPGAVQAAKVKDLRRKESQEYDIEEREKADVTADTALTGKRVDRIKRGFGWFKALEEKWVVYRGKALEAGIAPTEKGIYAPMTSMKDIREARRNLIADISGEENLARALEALDDFQAKWEVERDKEAASRVTFWTRDPEVEQLDWTMLPQLYGGSIPGEETPAQPKAPAKEEAPAEIPEFKTTEEAEASEIEAGTTIKVGDKYYTKD